MDKAFSTSYIVAILNLRGKTAVHLYIIMYSLNSAKQFLCQILIMRKDISLNEQYRKIFL
jgi:hypothetical protein